MYRKLILMALVGLLQPAIVQAACDPVREIEKKDGSCQSCPGWTKVQLDKSMQTVGQCGPDKCTDRQKLTVYGNCKDCQDHSKAREDGKECYEPKCKYRQILKKDATCEYCPDYERALTKTYCSPPKCSESQYITQDGECNGCDSAIDGRYKRASENGRECIQVTCQGRQVLKYGGKCKDCPDYERPQGKFKCYADCKRGEKVLIDGTCQKVPQEDKKAADSKHEEKSQDAKPLEKAVDPMQEKVVEQEEKSEGGWTLRTMFKNSPLHHLRINGNELIDLIPDAWTTRIERVVNKINNLSDKQIPKKIQVAADGIQSLMDHMEDEKNVQQIQDDFRDKMGDSPLSIEIKGLKEMVGKFGNMIDSMGDVMKNIGGDPMEEEWDEKPDSELE